MPQRNKAFVSYSHANRTHLKRLQMHLKQLEDEYSIEYWEDTKIKPGQQWQEEIHGALERTAVAILLISADFSASDFL